MAYDKVIDSAQLDTAITATANAIREKTGDTALIEWLADSGFADAVAAIEGGGGAKVAYGTVMAASTSVAGTLIQHNLGVVPTIGIFIRIDGKDVTSTPEIFSIYQTSDGRYQIVRTYNQTISILSGTGNSMTATQSTLYFGKATETDIRTPTHTIAGHNYFWAFIA